MSYTVLIVEDEADLRKATELALKYDFTIFTAANCSSALDILSKQTIDACVCDIMLGEKETGLDLLKQIKLLSPSTEVIILTGVQDIQAAKKAITLGAYDFLNKPIDPDKLIHTLKLALEKQHLRDTLHALQSDLQLAKMNIIIKSEVMQNIVTKLQTAAQSDIPILLTGESGTGKEVLARMIHGFSIRSKMPFVAVHCGAIPETLLESTLFGVEKGAYTDAHENRMGKIEMANGGILFLDEIGTMPAVLQTKLLRVLQEHTIERVGGNQTQKVDIKIVSATNEILQEQIKTKLFRLDLYHRLAGLEILIPPLRERKEDILELANYYLHRFNKKYNHHFTGLDKMTERILRSYHWPGNIRELEHMLEQIIMLHDETLITPRMLPANVLNCSEDIGQGEIELTTDCFVIRSDDYNSVFDEFERFFVRRALKKTKGNQTHAAKLMGISRTALTSKISVKGIRE